MRKTLVQVEREFITSGRSTGHLELQQTSKQVEAFTTVVLVKKKYTRYNVDLMMRSQDRKFTPPKFSNNINKSVR